MPLKGKKEHSPLGYAVLRSVGAVMKKTVKFSLILTLGMELSVRAVDAAADVSGYNDKYTENASEIINEMESELNIDIPMPEIRSSFVATRAAMMEFNSHSMHAIKRGYSPLDYIAQYYSTTIEALLINRYISQTFGFERSNVAALYGNNTVCFSPFDNFTEFTEEERETLAHEIMHNYVESINKDILKCNNLEELAVRMTVHEGIAKYAANLVYGKSIFISIAGILAPIQDQRKLYWDKYTQYVMGTNFVAKAVDRMGFGAIGLIAKYPPSNLEDIANPEIYFDWLETNNH